MPTGTLPASGKKLWESIYDASIKAGDSKDVAARKAWSGVKSAGFSKANGKWTKKSDFMAEASMYITKSTLDNGIMRWAAVNSDTNFDLYKERMSIELYRDFIGNIKDKVPVPPVFKSDVCSDFWCGGMPYVSISHYPDMNGQAVPGETLALMIDGDKLKAKGILYDNALGHSVWRSLKQDKVKSPDEKIRISIGFLDLAHKHGDDGLLFVRDSLYSLCPQCLEGVGDKIYVKGYLVHLALTRVPVNERTEIVLEEKAMSKKRITRKEDAASIVGDELAEEIELKQKATAQRSDVLIEMSDTEPTEEETAELIAEVEKGMGEDEEEDDCVDENGVEIKGCKDKKKEKSDTIVVEESVVVEKFEDDAMEKVVNEPNKYVASLPYGGATSMRDAEAYEESKEEMLYVTDMWNVFCNVAWNIFTRDDVPDKKEALTIAVDEFKNVLTAKAMLMFSTTAEKAQISEHELKPAIDALLGSIDNSIVLESDMQRAEVINPALQELGKSITDYVTAKSVVVEEKPVPTENSDKDTLLEDIKNVIQPLSDAVGELRQEVSLLKSKSTAQSVETKNAIPRPRTAIPSDLRVAASNEPKPGSVDYIARKSVGL